MSTPPTTVRDGETFVAPDDQPLVEFIREHAAAKRVVIQARQRLSGGAIQENWLLDLLIEGGPGLAPGVGCCAAMRFPRYPPAWTANRSSRCCKWFIRPV